MTALAAKLGPPLGLALLNAALGCGPTVAPALPPPAIDAVIEPSAGENDEARFGAGDADAERCLTRAAASPTGCEPEDTCVTRCRTNDLDACADLADGLFAKEPVCAEKIRELACNVDHPRSCAALAEQLLGRDQQPATRIRQLLDRACQGGVAKACTRLAGLEDARLGRRDANVSKLLERGCELGDGEACFTAATLRIGVGRLDAHREKLLERGCDLGHDAACLTLGRALVFSLTAGGVDPARGERLLSGLCDGTSASAGEACFILAQVLESRSPNAGTTFNQRACDKGNFNACTSIVSAHYTSARYAEAIALSTKLIASQPTHWLPRYTRGMSLLDTGQHGEAVKDLEVLCPARRDWPHCELWLYAARERAGQDGKPLLDKGFRDFDQVAWPAPVFRHFLGKLSAAQVLAAAKDKDAQKQLEQQCEAYYYVGQQLLIEGKTERAKAMFQKSVATQITNFIEYAGAKAELAMLTP